MVKGLHFRGMKGGERRHCVSLWEDPGKADLWNKEMEEMEDRRGVVLKGVWCLCV